MLIEQVLKVVISSVFETRINRRFHSLTCRGNLYIVKQEGTKSQVGCLCMNA